MRKRVEFSVEGQKIVGDLHLPDDFKPPFPCVVLSHGYMSNRGGEKHVQVGYRFPLEGIAVLRFDHRGAINGESSGKFEDTTLTGRVADLAAALDYLKTVKEIDGSRIGLLGSSMGGMTILALPKNESIKAIVLLSTPTAFPPLNAAGKESLAPSGYLQYPDGARIKKAFFDDLSRYTLREEVKKIHCPLLIVHGDVDEVVPRHQAFMLYQDAGQTKQLRLIAGGDHSFSSTETMNEVLALALDWFKKYLV